MSPLSITGTTKFYALIGHPVEQVRTPTVLNAHLTGHGIDAAMVTFNLLPSSLEDFFNYPQLVTIIKNCKILIDSNFQSVSS